MQDFRKLKVWRKSHDLTLQVYAATTTFPKEEVYGLTSQIRRAATSVPANTAEVCGRGGNVEFARFLSIAMRSASELEYHLLLSRDLKVLPDEEHARLAGENVEVKRMLVSLTRKLRIANVQDLKTDN